ncbi:MAG TPA: hypothetical protein VF197_19835 [Methylomirabilota bacterium]|jgi:hypothetical protein
MKKALAALVAALVVLAAAVYFFVARPLLRPSEVTAVAERALVADDLLALAAVNVKQAVFIEKWLLGAPRATPVADTAPRPVADRSLVDHLRAAGVDPRHDVDAALFALYPADGATARHAMILIGRFNPAALNGYLGRELAATPRPGAAPASFTVARIDAATCRPGATWAVTVTPEWIAFSDPASHAALLARLAGGSAGGAGTAERLAWWRGLSRGDVAAVGLPGLERLESGATQPFARGGAKALAAQTEPFGRAYAGLGVKTVPPQGVLRLVLDAKDPARGREKVREWERALAESRARWKDSVPTVAALYDSLRVHGDGARSTLEFTVDRTLASNAQRAVNELVTLALGGFGIRVDPPGGAAPAERIDPEPVAFVPSVTPGALPGYDPQAQFAEEVDQVQGPFGVRVDELRLGPGSDPSSPAGPPSGLPAGLEIVVEGFAGELPNVGGSEDRVRLFVDSVKGAGGHELLRPEACGRERNDRPAPFQSAGGKRLRARKTVRLVAGADPRAVQSVAGHVQLRLPTRTEVVTLASPRAGAVAERGGAVFTVTALEPGRVSYQVTGARSRLLLFRALNAKGQPLASPGAFSSEFMFGEGVSGQRQYSGEISRLEIVFAADEETMDLPFTLTSFVPAGRSAGAAIDRTPPFRPYGLRDLQREFPRPRGAGPLEPFELTLDRVQSFFGLRLDLTLKSPPVPNFERGFTSGVFRMTRIELADGTALTPPAPDPARPGPSRSRWEQAVRFTGSPKDGRLSTPLVLYVESKVRPEDVKAVKGTLTLQLPRTLQTISLGDLTVGEHAERGDLAVTVVARGRHGLTLATSRDGDRVRYVRLLGADGQAVAYWSPDITEAPNGAWRFGLSPQSPAVKAEVVLADQVDRADYPVTLTPR